MLLRRVLVLASAASAFVPLATTRCAPLRSSKTVPRALPSLAPSTLIAYAADLPDPRIPVAFLALLAVAFVFTQISFVGVVQEEDRVGAESGRKARQQMARQRGYFKNKRQQ